MGWDPRQLLVQLLEEFRALFLAHRGVEDKGEVDPEHAERRSSLARTFTSAHLEWVLQALADAQADMRLSTHPRLTLEVALARASNLEVRETQTVVARLERLERRCSKARRRSARHRQGVGPAGAAAACDEARAAGGRRRADVRCADGRAGCRRPAEPATSRRRLRAGRRAAPVDGSLQQQWDAVLEAVRGAQSRHAHPSAHGVAGRARDRQARSSGSTRTSTRRSCRTSRSTCQRITDVLEQVFGRKLSLDPQVGARSNVPDDGSNGGSGNGRDRRRRSREARLGGRGRRGGHAPAELRARRPAADRRAQPAPRDRPEERAASRAAHPSVDTARTSTASPTRCRR